MDQPRHSDAVCEALDRVKVERDVFLRLGMDLMQADNGNMYPFDLLCLGTLKRYLSTADGFRLMIETRNMACARALLRIHIDTALRFSAGWLVERPHEFAANVFGGERIDKMKDRNGNRLTDKFLVETHKAAFPWLPEVYRRLSGYVHLSGSHIAESMDLLDKDGRTVSVAITAQDTKYPDQSWVELLHCFVEVSTFLGRHVVGWTMTKNGNVDPKNMPPDHMGREV